MASDDRLKKAIELAQHATDKDLAGEYEEALGDYCRAIETWQLVCKYQTNPLFKERLYQKMEPYVARAEKIKEYLQTQKKAEPTAETTNGRLSDTTPTAQASAKTPSRGSPQQRISTTNGDQLRAGIENTIVVAKPTVTWDSVAGLQAAKDALHEAVTLPIKFPHLFVGERKPWRGILLYGPPGTGKTHLAKAAASDASATFLAVSSADLLSKWQGESEKLVRMLFETARDRAPAIVFIDEIDSLCCSRGGQNENESSRRIKTEFLVQMEGIEQLGQTKRILILGATNTPWALDVALRRRFDRKIYIPLPGLTARHQMFKIHIGATPNSLTDTDLWRLADATEGFSGSDIAIVVRDALFEPVRKCRLATHFKRLSVESLLKSVLPSSQTITAPPCFFTPCDADDPDPTKEKRDLLSIPGNQLLAPDLCMADFTAALAQSKPSVRPEDIEAHEKWTTMFGIEGQ